MRIQTLYRDLFYNSGKSLYALTQGSKTDYNRMSKWIQKLPQSIEKLEEDLNSLGYQLTIEPYQGTDIVQNLSMEFRSHSELYLFRDFPLMSLELAQKISKTYGKFTQSEINQALRNVIEYWNSNAKNFSN